MVQLATHLLVNLITHLTLLKLTLAQHHHLTVYQFVALGILAAQGPVGLTELRKLLAVPKSTLTFLIDTLDKRGLIKKNRASHDRRRWIVTLTPRGVDFYRDVSQYEAASLEPLVNLLASVDSAALVEVFEKLPSGGTHLSETVD